MAKKADRTKRTEQPVVKRSEMEKCIAAGTLRSRCGEPLLLRCSQCSEVMEAEAWQPDNVCPLCSGKEAKAWICNRCGGEYDAPPVDSTDRQCRSIERFPITGIAPFPPMQPAEPCEDTPKKGLSGKQIVSGLMVGLGTIAWLAFTSMQEDPNKVAAQAQPVIQQPVQPPDSVRVEPAGIPVPVRPEVTANTESRPAQERQATPLPEQATREAPVEQASPPVAVLTIDERYEQLLKSRCDGSFFCGEKLRWKLCKGKWSEDPPPGQKICQGSPAANPNQ